MRIVNWLLWPLEKVESVRPFTEAEAWWLFRAVAFAEAIGWTILIIGLLIRHYGLASHNIAVPIAGQIHGMIFLTYFGILLAVYSSLRWSRLQFLLALMAGVPPYGSLVFERWAAWRRHNSQTRLHFRSIVLSQLG